MASAAAASGGNLKSTEAFNIEVLSTALNEHCKLWIDDEQWPLSIANSQI